MTLLYGEVQEGDQNFWFRGGPAWWPGPDARRYKGPVLGLWRGARLPIATAWDGLEFL